MKLTRLLPQRSYPLYFLIGGLGLLAISLPLVGISFFARVQPQAESSEAAPALPQAVRVAALGRLEPSSGVVQVGAPLNEILSQLLVQEGDTVTKGQVVAYLKSYQERLAEVNAAQQQLVVAQERLEAESKYNEAQLEAIQTDSRSLPAVQDQGIAAQQATIGRLQTELTFAQSDLDRYQLLYEQGALSKSELDQRISTVEQLHKQIGEAEATLQQLVATRDREIANVTAQLNTEQVNRQRIRAQSDVNTAKESLRLAKVRLENALVRSPIAGRVLQVMTYPGETISDSGRGRGAILEIADTRNMNAVAEVHESKIRNVKVGQRARIISRNNAFTQEVMGTVVEIGNQIFKQNVLNDDPAALTDARVVEVKIRLDDSSVVERFTNLQIDVEIETDTNPPSPKLGNE